MASTWGHQRGGFNKINADEGHERMRDGKFFYDKLKK